jgi:alkanesulfonate monooxygenase SsuD/methylene tetrahydromethanopterin reductase-like flavin-dependent oxidoreductase (luciferase family)
MNKLEFYMIHLMPYPYIPPGEDIESTWVTLSNSFYDPRIGHRVYNEYLEQLVAAEKFGYDGIIVNEHHQNAYGTMPAPNLWAAFLAARTQRIKIGIVGNALPLHANPVRVAEEIAMLDVVSGGRVISGHVRGLGAEYHSSGMNPTQSKDRFWEANDLIVKAWTEDGPFSWEGDFYNLPYVNPWPRPIQKPHPPIWLPGTGSLETIEEAAQRRYAFMMSTNSQWFSKQAFDLLYRVAEEQYGYTPALNQVGRLVPSYVAETDEQAHREAMPHVMWFFRNGLKIPSHHIMPPGYMSSRSMANSLAGRAKHGVKNFWEMDYDELVGQGYVIVGSPETVIEKYTQLSEELRVGMIIGAGGHLGAMPHWMVLKNMQIMAEEVMPHFRGPEGKPTWALGESAVPETYSGRAAVIGAPKVRPTARVAGDEYIECEIGHIPEIADSTRRRDLSSSA